MATTSLASAVSTYAVNYRHGFFSLTGSTPDSGNVRDGWGEWFVARNGTIIKREFGPLRFGWMGRPGDVVTARYVDIAGNAGAHVSYTFTITTAYAYEQFVDASTGNNSNAGTSAGAPVQTIAQAKANIESNLTTDGVHCIWVREDQTHSCGGSAAWSGSNSTPAQVQFRRWGTSGAAPTMTFSNVSAFLTGKRQSVIVDGINLTGGYAGGFGVAFYMNRLGAGTRSSPQSALLNCSVSGFWVGFLGDEDVITGATRDAGDFDHIHVENVQFSGQDSYHIFDLHYVRYLTLRNVSMGSQTIVNPMRVYSLGDHYFEDLVCDTGNAGSIRFQLEIGATAGIRRGTHVRIRHIGTDASLSGITYACGGGNGISYVDDIEMIGCELHRATMRFPLNQISGTNSLQVDQFRAKNCTFNSGIALQAASGGGTYSNVSFRNCAFIGTHDWAGNTQGIIMDGTADRYGATFLTFVGNVAYWPRTGADAPRQVLSSSSMNRATLAGKVGSCDYNRAGKVDGNSVNWIDATDGSRTLAQWQADASKDANSSVTLSSTFSLTNNAVVSGVLNVRPTATGPMQSGGAPDTYALDGDGYLRDGSPDAGPYEFGASTRPADPGGSGGDGSSARRVGMKLAFGLRM